jgi:hypothetical protein
MTAFAGTLGAVATKDIRPSTAHTICAVCGRTLLRGERAEAYLQGGDRRWVCELCKSRAVHEGWVREGTVPAYDQGRAGTERRRSLLGRLRARRERPGVEEAEPHTEIEEPAHAVGWAEPPPESASHWDPGREPRHVRAVPTSPEHKMSSAVEAFNSSEHTRTVAGVARSLGLPIVSVNPSTVRPSLVNLVVSWELCWYRYEVDLSDEVPNVRVAAQGYELNELPAEERQANAAADDNGLLELATVD